MSTTQSSAKVAPPAMSELDLRDYFAAKAMLALVADPELSFLGGMEDRIAKASYVMADAMLKARSA